MKPPIRKVNGKKRPMMGRRRHSTKTDSNTENMARLMMLARDVPSGTYINQFEKGYCPTCNRVTDMKRTDYHRYCLVCKNTAPLEGRLDPPMELTDVVQTKPGEKPYWCRFCGASFEHYYQQVQHHESGKCPKEKDRQASFKRYREGERSDYFEKPRTNCIECGSQGTVVDSPAFPGKRVCIKCGKPA